MFRYHQMYASLALFAAWSLTSHGFAPSYPSMQHRQQTRQSIMGNGAVVVENGARALSLKSRASQNMETNKPLETAPKQLTLLAATTAVLVSSSNLLLPLVATAAELVDDGYEYGAVDAPIGIAVAGGILAILTALLPVALRGGEEAFEEIKDRDKGSFGKPNDLLKKK
jgi:hypothetical protein